MIDLDAMRTAREDERRGQAKVHLTKQAHARLKQAASYAGCYISDIVEKLVMEYLPPAPENVKPGHTKRRKNK